MKEESEYTARGCCVFFVNEIINTRQWVRIGERGVSKMRQRSKQVRKEGRNKRQNETKLPIIIRTQRVHDGNKVHWAAISYWERDSQDLPTQEVCPVTRLTTVGRKVSAIKLCLFVRKRKQKTTGPPCAAIIYSSVTEVLFVLRQINNIELSPLIATCT